jgi:hypothetical protein
MGMEMDDSKRTGGFLCSEQNLSGVGYYIFLGYPWNLYRYIPNPNRFSGKIFSNASEELLTICLLITYVVFVVLSNI